MASKSPEFGQFMVKRIQFGNIENGYLVEFNDMIEFFAINPGKWLNSRFEPQSKQCQVCSYNYSHIIRLEYVNEEVNFLLSQTGYDVIINQPFFNKGQASYTNEEFLTWGWQQFRIFNFKFGCKFLYDNLLQDTCNILKFLRTADSAFFRAIIQ